MTRSRTLAAASVLAAVALSLICVRHPHAEVLNRPVSYGAGPGSAGAAASFQAVSTDPSAPAAGTVWYNSTAHTNNLASGTGRFSTSDQRFSLDSDLSGAHRLQGTIGGSNAQADIDVHGIPVLNVGVNSDPGTTINVGAAPGGVTTQTNVNGNLVRMVAGASGMDFLAGTGANQYRPIAIWGTAGVKRLQLTEQSDQMFSFNGRLEGDFQMLAGDHRFLVDKSTSGRGGDLYYTAADAATGSGARGGIVNFSGGAGDGAGAAGYVALGATTVNGALTVTGGVTATGGTSTLGATAITGALTFSGGGALASSLNPSTANTVRIGSSGVPLLGVHTGSSEGFVVHGDLINSQKLTCDYVSASGLSRCTGDNRYLVSAPTSVALQSALVQLTPNTGGYSQAIDVTGAHYLWRATADNKLGFYDAPPTSRPSVGAATLVNNVTGGGTTGVVDDIGAAGLEDAASLADTRNAIYQLARRLRELELCARTVGVCGS